MWRSWLSAHAWGAWGRPFKSGHPEFFKLIIINEETINNKNIFINYFNTHTLLIILI